MQITLINVGYGDAILLQAADGTTVLLDGGSALPEEYAGDPYRIRCIDYLRSHGIEHLDAVWISHIHEDHVCGLLPVFEQLQVDRVYTPYPSEPFLQGRRLTPGPGAPRSVPLYTAALNDYRAILLLCRERNIPVTTVAPGDRVTLPEGTAFDVLCPRREVLETYMGLIRDSFTADDPTEALTRLDAMSNRTSLLLHIMGDGLDLLTAADCIPAEWIEVDPAALQQVNVLKLPHHGQADSVSRERMGFMSLRFVVTTSASDRRYRSANEAVYREITSWYPPKECPRFLFTDERSYPPYFEEPAGFRAITLQTGEEGLCPVFERP